MVRAMRCAGKEMLAREAVGWRPSPATGRKENTMATAGEGPGDLRAPAAGQRPDGRPGWLVRATDAGRPIWDFWIKINNDWVFNLAGLLAYNLLMSMLPLLLVVLAAVGFLLGAQAPQTLARLEAAFAAAVPGGGEIFQVVTKQLAASAGPLLIFGLGMAAFTGSRLFVVIENCFGIIFGIRGRDFMRQNVMAFGMLLLYLVLVPAIAVSAVIPETILRFLDPLLRDHGSTLVTDAFAIGASSLCALAMFGAIYLVVPNRRMRPHEIWPGTLVATVLLIIFQLVFPLYARVFVSPQNLGAVVGFAIVILVFLYYLAFILLLGAEVNAWIAGRRPLPGDVAAMMHAMRTRPQPPEAAGDPGVPAAGSAPQT